MILLNLYILSIFLTISCQAFDMGNIVFYLKNLYESRKALPTLETDFITANVAALDFLSTNFDTYNIEDSYLNISQLINKYGFPFEQHEVVTEDGYILTLHRIPSKGPVVFLNHGILLSSLDYITAGPAGSTAFYLASRGYDVWLGNARGNRFSRRNLYINPEDQSRFFNFTFHEIGFLDLPVTIDYILGETRQKKMNYVGFSQGTTAFFVLCSLKPEYNEKIKVMVALSPIAWFSHLFSPVLRLAYKLNIFRILMAIGKYDILSDPSLLYLFCNNNNIFKFICINGMYISLGFDRGLFNYTNIPVITRHTFAGASAKQFDHYGQVIYTGKFRQYDFGVQGNLERYGSKVPPDYPVNKVTAPVVLTYSFSDFFSSVVDVLQLRRSLPNVVGFFEAKSYNHVDYNFSRNLNNVINKRILDYIERFSNT